MQGGFWVHQITTRLYALDVAEDNPSQEDLSGFSKSFYLLLIN
jgi:hypothetical protein